MYTAGVGLHSTEGRECLDLCAGILLWPVLGTQRAPWLDLMSVKMRMRRGALVCQRWQITVTS